MYGIKSTRYGHMTCIVKAYKAGWVIYFKFGSIVIIIIIITYARLCVIIVRVYPVSIGTIHYNEFLTMMLGKKSTVLKL